MQKDSNSITKLKYFNVAKAVILCIIWILTTLWRIIVKKVTSFEHRPRVQYRPEIKEHRMMYFKFRVDNKWGQQGCPFDLEEGFVSIPALCEKRTLDYYANVELTT